MDKPRVLTEDEVKQATERLQGWIYAENKLTKEFEFLDFVGCLSFLNRMIVYFQEMDHHPDVHIFYNKMKMELTRYDAGAKVTDRDVEVAKKINETYETENKL